jgi:hypothetical protein
MTNLAAVASKHAILLVVARVELHWKGAVKIISLISYMDDQYQYLLYHQEKEKVQKNYRPNSVV